MLNITPEALVEKFVQIANGVRNMRWRMGEIYNDLVKLESQAAAGRRLRNALPSKQAKALLGYALTDTNLKAMGTMASVFHADGAVVSPDGRHSVDREAIEAFGLTPAQTAEVATHLQAGKLRVKQVASMARKAGKAAEGSEKHAAIVGKLLFMLAEARGEKAAPTVAFIAAEIERVDKSIARAQAKRDKLVKQMTKLREGKQDETPAPAPTKVDAPTITKGSARKRSATPPQPAA